MNPQFEFNWEAEPLDEAPPAPQKKCTASESVLERIKKLLRLARDKAATRAEAEAATGMAFDLAERHHVDVAALNLDDAGEPLVGDTFKCGQADPFTRAIVGVVRDFFHIEPCFTSGSVLFVGRETDVQIAGYMFDYIRRAGRASCREYTAAEIRQRRKDTPEKRANFLAGFSWGIRRQLSETRLDLHLTDGQNALVLAEATARKSKLDEMMPDMRIIKPKPMRKVRSAASLGYVSGRDTQIRKPLGNSEALRLT